MGIYLNPRNDGFQESIRSMIYVDKTGLIVCTNRLLDTEEKYVCVSRPRRFGKSMALKMLAAYYSRGCESRKLFAGLKIESDSSFAEYLNQIDVIFLNMQEFLIGAEKQDVTRYLEREVLEELCEEYEILSDRQNWRLTDALKRIYIKTGRKFIFLIDEWDCVMRERQESEEMQKQYLDFLRWLLKDQPYVALAYMTGILPVKKYGKHSALNMFWEYSMTDQDIFEEYTGFTEAEVKELCGRYDMDFSRMSSWYDGYVLRQFKHIYNPRSVVGALRRRYFSNYWTSTETYEALKIYMDMDFDGLRADIVKMLGGGRIRINTFSFRNDMRTFETKDDVLTLLIHLGYLGYDAERGEAFIPNKEIIGEFENAMSTGGWSEIMRVIKASEKLLNDTLSGDEESVAEALDRAHTEVASVLTYNDENSQSLPYDLCGKDLGAAISLAYYSARKDYRLIREMPTGRGFADVVFWPLPASGKPALVVELKYGGSAEGAIEQIKRKQYTQAMEGYTGEILLVGINYDKDGGDKAHSCVIERVIRDEEAR